MHVELECDVTGLVDLVLGGFDPLFYGCGDCRSQKSSSTVFDMLGLATFSGWVDIGCWLEAIFCIMACGLF